MSTLTVKGIAAPVGYDLAMPAGHIIQVVNATHNTTVVLSSTTLTDTGLTATITPKFATSKILVEVHQNGVQKANNNASNDVTIKLFRGSTLILMPTQFATYTASSLQNYEGTVSASYLDSPATTSATTYKTQFANPDGGGAGGTVYVQTGTAASTITLMEVAG